MEARVSEDKARSGKASKLFASDDKRLKGIADGVVLHEDFVRLQHLLDVFNAVAMAWIEASPSPVFQIPLLEAIPQTPVRAALFRPWSSCLMPQPAR